jgi:hypothetical protein
VGKIFGLKREGVTGVWRKSTMRVFTIYRLLFAIYFIIRAMNSISMRRVGREREGGGECVRKCEKGNA